MEKTWSQMTVKERSEPGAYEAYKAREQAREDARRAQVQAIATECAREIMRKHGSGWTLEQRTDYDGRPLGWWLITHSSGPCLSVGCHTYDKRATLAASTTPAIHPFFRGGDSVGVSIDRPPVVAGRDLVRRFDVPAFLAAWIKADAARAQAEDRKAEAQGLAEEFRELVPDAHRPNHGGRTDVIYGRGVTVSIDERRDDAPPRVSLHLDRLTVDQARELLKAWLANGGAHEI